MKKILTIALALVAGVCANAQLAPTTVGKVFTYSDVNTGENSHNHTVTSTVESVVTEDGTTTVKVVNHTETGTLKTVPDSKTTYIFGEGPSAPTTVLQMSADEMKELIANSIRSEISSSGQFVSEDDLNSLLNQMRPTGKLQLVIDPAAAVDSKIPNSSLRMSMEMMTMAMHISGGKFLGFEEVTTPAGTFNCAKVSYVYKMNMGSASEKINNTAWFAEGVGLVKEEGRMRGELVSTQTLTSISE